MLKYIQQFVHTFLKEASKTRPRSRRSSRTSVDTKENSSMKPEILAIDFNNEGQEAERSKEILELKRTYSLLMKKFVNPNLDLMTDTKTANDMNILSLKGKQELIRSIINKIFNERIRQQKQLEGSSRDFTEGNVKSTVDEEPSFGWSGQRTSKQAAKPMVETSSHSNNIATALSEAPIEPISRNDRQSNKEPKYQVKLNSPKKQLPNSKRFKNIVKSEKALGLEAKNSATLETALKHNNSKDQSIGMKLSTSKTSKDIVLPYLKGSEISREIKKEHISDNGIVSSNLNVDSFKETITDSKKKLCPENIVGSSLLSKETSNELLEPSMNMELNSHSDINKSFTSLCHKKNNLIDHNQKKNISIIRSINKVDQNRKAKSDNHPINEKDSETVKVIKTSITDQNKPTKMMSNKLQNTVKKLKTPDKKQKTTVVVFKREETPNKKHFVEKEEQSSIHSKMPKELSLDPLPNDFKLTSSIEKAPNLTDTTVNTLSKNVEVSKSSSHIREEANKENEMPSRVNLSKPNIETFEKEQNQTFCVKAHSQEPSGSVVIEQANANIDKGKNFIPEEGGKIKKPLRRFDRIQKKKSKSKQPKNQPLPVVESVQKMYNKFLNDSNHDKMSSHKFKVNKDRNLINKFRSIMGINLDHLAINRSSLPSDTIKGKSHSNSSLVSGSKTDTLNSNKSKTITNSQKTTVRSTKVLRELVQGVKVNKVNSNIFSTVNKNIDNHGCIDKTNPSNLIELTSKEIGQHIIHDSRSKIKTQFDLTKPRRLHSKKKICKSSNLQMYGAKRNIYTHSNPKRNLLKNIVKDCEHENIGEPHFLNLATGSLIKVSKLTACNQININPVATQVRNLHTFGFRGKVKQLPRKKKTTIIKQNKQNTVNTASTTLYSPNNEGTVSNSKMKFINESFLNVDRSLTKGSPYEIIKESSMKDLEPNCEKQSEIKDNNNGSMKYTSNPSLLQSFLEKKTDSNIKALYINSIAIPQSLDDIKINSTEVLLNVDSQYSPLPQKNVIAIDSPKWKSKTDRLNKWKSEVDSNITEENNKDTDIKTNRSSESYSNDAQDKEFIRIGKDLAPEKNGEKKERSVDRKNDSGLTFSYTKIKKNNFQKDDAKYAKSGKKTIKTEPENKKLHNDPGKTILMPLPPKSGLIENIFESNNLTSAKIESSKEGHDHNKKVASTDKIKEFESKLRILESKLSFLELKSYEKQNTESLQKKSAPEAKGNYTTIDKNKTLKFNKEHILPQNYPMIKNSKSAGTESFSLNKDTISTSVKYDSKSGKKNKNDPKKEDLSQKVKNLELKLKNIETKISNLKSNPSDLANNKELHKIPSFTRSAEENEKSKPIVIITKSYERTNHYNYGSNIKLGNLNYRDNQNNIGVKNQEINGIKTVIYKKPEVYLKHYLTTTKNNVEENVQSVKNTSTFNNTKLPNNKIVSLPSQMNSITKEPKLENYNFTTFDKLSEKVLNQKLLPKSVKFSGIKEENKDMPQGKNNNDLQKNKKDLKFIPIEISYPKKTLTQPSNSVSNVSNNKNISGENLCSASAINNTSDINVTIHKGRNLSKSTTSITKPFISNEGPLESTISNLKNNNYISNNKTIKRPNNKIVSLPSQMNSSTKEPKLKNYSFTTIDKLSEKVLNQKLLPKSIKLSGIKEENKDMPQGKNKNDLQKNKKDLKFIPFEISYPKKTLTQPSNSVSNVSNNKNISGENLRSASAINNTSDINVTIHKGRNLSKSTSCITKPLISSEGPLESTISNLKNNNYNSNNKTIKRTNNKIVSLPSQMNSSTKEPKIKNYNFTTIDKLSEKVLNQKLLPKSVMLSGIKEETKDMPQGKNNNNLQKNKKDLKFIPIEISYPKKALTQPSNSVSNMSNNKNISGQNFGSTSVINNTSDINVTIHKGRNLSKSTYCPTKPLKPFISNEGALESTISSLKNNNYNEEAKGQNIIRSRKISKKKAPLFNVDRKIVSKRNSRQPSSKKNYRHFNCRSHLEEKPNTLHEGLLKSLRLMTSVGPAHGNTIMNVIEKIGSNTEIKLPTCEKISCKSPEFPKRLMQTLKKPTSSPEKQEHNSYTNCKLELAGNIDSTELSKSEQDKGNTNQKIEKDYNSFDYYRPKRRTYEVKHPIENEKYGIKFPKNSENYAAKVYQKHLSQNTNPGF